MNRFFLLSILSLCALVQATAQLPYTTLKTAPEKAEKLYRQAMEDVDFDRPDRAIKAYEKALVIAPDFIEARIQLGGLQFGRGKFELAIAQLLEAYRLDAAFNPQVPYTIGVAYWELDRFAEAIPYLDTCIALEKSPHELRRRARKMRQDCLFSQQAVHQPVAFEPKPMPNSINTEQGEILPTLTTDGSSLIFVRRGTSEDFYESRLVDSVWRVAEPIESINTHENEGSQSLSADGRLMIITRCNVQGGLGSCDLYWTSRTPTGWSRPKNLGAPVNTSGWESQPALSPDGRSLIFSSDRPNGYGGKDLWITRKDASGKWTTPVNIGDTINSEWDEQAPFWHPDGVTLYFNSEGHPGLGSADLYFSKLNEQQRWGPPVNLGYPINSKGHDGTIFVLADGQSAYFASDRFSAPGQRKNLDIFSFVLPQGARAKPISYIKGIVRNAVNGQPIQARVEITVRSQAAKPWKLDADSLRGFLVTLPSGQEYSMQVYAPGYLFYSNYFAPGAANSAINPYHLDIALSPLAGMKGAVDTLVLNNLFFASNSSTILPESEKELGELMALLKNNPGLSVEIIGHTDAIGQEEANRKLSMSRAQSVQAYLAAGGIDIKRLQCSGMGESRPVDSNDTEEGRQRNRRTEFRLYTQ